MRMNIGSKLSRIYRRWCFLSSVNRCPGKFCLEIVRTSFCKKCKYLKVVDYWKNQQHSIEDEQFIMNEIEGSRCTHLRRILTNAWLLSTTYPQHKRNDREIVELRFEERMKEKNRIKKGRRVRSKNCWLEYRKLNRSIRHSDWRSNPKNWRHANGVHARIQPSNERIVDPRNWSRCQSTGWKERELELVRRRSDCRSAGNFCSDRRRWTFPSSSVRFHPVAFSRWSADNHFYGSFSRLKLLVTGVEQRIDWPCHPVP